MDPKGSYYYWINRFMHLQGYVTIELHSIELHFLFSIVVGGLIWFPTCFLYISLPKKHPVQVLRLPSNFAPGIKTKFNGFSGEMYKKNQIHRGQLIFQREAKQKLFLKKIKFTGISWFSTGELTKNYINKMHRFLSACCYFGQNPKRKGSISPSNFNGQLPNILFTCLSLCLGVLRFAAVA